MLPDQAATMLELQAMMNSKVDSNWLLARYPYLRAVAIEGAEAIEHHGWKWQEYKTMEAYIPEDDAWHAHADMKHYRMHFAAAALGGKIYAVGGTGNRWHTDGAVNNAEAYDPVLNSWSYVAAMTSKRNQHSVFVMSGKLFAVGGHDGSYDT